MLIISAGSGILTHEPEGQGFKSCAIEQTMRFRRIRKILSYSSDDGWVK